MREISPEKKEAYLEVLREGKTPFSSFVSRKNMEDMVDIANPRKEIDRFVFRTIHQTQGDHSSRLLPILGPAGSGKTHTYWAYKNLERHLTVGSTSLRSESPIEIPKNWTIIYVPSPPMENRLLLHIYTCLLDELSHAILESVASTVVARWSATLAQKKGLFKNKDAELEEIIHAGMQEYPGIYADPVKCLVLYALSKDKKKLAERWLLGEELSNDELNQLKVHSIIESEELCLAMIRLICENAGKVVILYFDELENLYRSFGPSFTKKLLTTIRRIYTEIKNVVIIIAVLTELWKDILALSDASLQSQMEQARELKPFVFEDLLTYFELAMKWVWTQNKVDPLEDVLFPLNKEILKVIFDKTNGNQRSIIKLVQMYVNKILDDEDLDDE
jgi:Cdc6-like AAA superfamily ATPase